MAPVLCHHGAMDLSNSPDATTFPTARHTGCPFDPPDRLAPLRAERPLRPLRYPDGHLGRLATGHSTVRTIMADPRFSARYELMHLPMPGVAPEEIPPARTGDFLGMDAPAHTRYRRLLTGRFTVRRMRRLTERVEEITAGHLDAMERHGPTTDLVTAYAHPVPAQVMCELLGVPYADRERFTGQVATVFDQRTSGEEKNAAFAAVDAYLTELVAAKRARPTDDLLSDLTSSDLDEEELVGVGGLLLAAGLDTTANMIGLGTFALLSNPDQLAALRADPALAEPAVEELLRYLTVADPTLRVALQDVEVEGEVIRAGETVTLSLQAANRDPAKFPDPDRLDLHRTATGHVAFGHGAHQCLGQQLARVELQVALPALLRRFPTLRLAVDPADVPLREHNNIYGVQSLPVTWDQDRPPRH